MNFTPGTTLARADRLMMVQPWRIHRRHGKPLSNVMVSNEELEEIAHAIEWSNAQLQQLVNELQRIREPDESDHEPA